LHTAYQTANWCEPHYVKIVPHNPLGPVSATACLHLDLATDNFAVQEGGLVGTPVLQDLFPVQVPYRAGCLSPPARTWESNSTRRPPRTTHSNQLHSSPQLRREGGSFTNW
jgi:galactonate dehydratase